MAERAPRAQWLEGAGPGSLVLLGVAAWALLMLAGALAGMGGRIAPATLPQAAPLPAQAKPLPERIGPYAQYREAELRPLFATDRRPRPFLIGGPQQGQPSAPEQAPLNLQLTGVLISPRVQLATVQGAGGQPQRVRLGETPEGAAGWRLVSLAPRSAVFESSGGRQTLELQVSGVAGAPTPIKSAPPSMPAPPPPPPAPGTTPPADADAAADPAAVAAAEAAQAADNAAAMADAAAMSASQREQVEAIRARIEARRAQQNRSGPTPAPPRPNP